MKELARKNILSITPYVAGKPIEETKRELGLSEVIKLASNENPLGPSPAAVTAIKKSLSNINRYPDSCGFYLKKSLWRYLNVRPANIVLGNGSDELIDIIIKTFVEDDEAIITADTTFLEYKIISSVLGRRVIQIPLKNLKYDLEAIAKRIDKKTKLIFISNPNNPTGTYVTRYELEGFVKRLPKGILLVLDEAYDTFIDVNDFPKGLKYVGSSDSLTTGKGNVIVLKTFSKAYGLAGLRIGYAVTNPILASYMERARQPFNVNSLAQAAAIAALDDKEFLMKTRKIIQAGKNYISACLRKSGISYVPSVTNFILIDVARNSIDVFKEMLKLGVIVRDMSQYGLKNFIRVTIGTEEENKRFITALRKVIN